MDYGPKLVSLGEGFESSTTIYAVNKYLQKGGGDMGDNCEKHPGGRPIVLDYALIVEQFNKYIQDTDYPIIKEFCVLHGYSYGYLEELKLRIPEIAETIKRCLSKAEVYLEKNALHNKVNPVFAMFRLKQPCFAWTDRQDIHVNEMPTKLTAEEIKRRLEEKKKKEDNA